VRRDHRPYFVKKAYLRFQAAYARHFIKPRFDSLGDDFYFIHPWNIEVFGSPITIGKCANILTTRENKVRLTVWPEQKGKGRIAIGDYSLICPGVRISSADSISIGDNCMIAGSAYITDSDWHGIYDRVWSVGYTAPITIEENVWIGDGAVICKGVTIGQNSIVGIRSVVKQSIPANCIAVGNPAKVVKELDTKQPLRKRSDWYADPAALSKDIDNIDQEYLQGNTLLKWLRTMFFPKPTD
jgi:acetyltransferase-like isoleucine patch superfamily enzyme